MASTHTKANRPGQSRNMIYAAIEQFITEHHYSPTVRELAEMTGFSSTATIMYHLANMRADGLIDYEPTKPRTLRLLA